MKIKVGVFMGGFSSEWKISVQSGETVLANLNPTVFEAYKVMITQDQWFVELDGKKLLLNKADLTFELNDQTIHFDVIYNAIHGHPGEDGYMQAIFKLNNIPHSSSGFFESALTFNKLRTNELLKHHDVHVAKSMHTTDALHLDIEAALNTIGLPLFVKPNRSGSSFGVSRVTKASQMPQALKDAQNEDHQVILEQEIKGVEVGCGVVNKNGKTQAIAVTEIRSKTAFFDYQAKYEGASEEVTPAQIDPAVYTEICQLSERIYDYLNLWGVVRIDYIIQDNVPYLIEVNSVPGLSPASIIPQQVAYKNWALNDFFGGLLLESIKRHSS